MALCVEKHGKVSTVDLEEQTDEQTTEDNKRHSDTSTNVERDVEDSDDVSGNSDVGSADVDEHPDVAKDKGDVSVGNVRKNASWPPNVGGSNKTSYAEAAMKNVKKVF